MLKINQETLNKEVFEPYEEDSEYKECDREFIRLLETIKENNMRLYLDLEAASVSMQARAVEVTYQKAFHDGVRFILGAMNGKEVISFNA